MTFLGLYGFGWNDYQSEVLPAYNALLGGHVWRFLTLAPAYGGSLELRAPFALLPGLWSGHEVAVYQLVSMSCLFAAAAFAVWLSAQMRALGHSRLARAVVLGLCVANPVTLYALQLGHAEELLGAVLSVAAVVAAQRGRTGWSAVLLGLAIVNKQWALLAVAPVLMALPAHRVRALAIAGAIAAGFYAPLILPSVLAGHGAGAAALASSGGSTIFQPWQLWWFLGAHGHLVNDSFGAIKPGYRTAPAWIGSLVHPLILALAVPATLFAARRRRDDALLLLVFLFAIRTAFDTWDTVYYPLPFLIALLAWETFRWSRPPALSLLASVTIWLVFIALPQRLSADAQALAFALVALPTLVAIACALYAPRALRDRVLPRLRRVSAPIASSSAAAPSRAVPSGPISTM